MTFEPVEAILRERRVHFVEKARFPEPRLPHDPDDLPVSRLDALEAIV
jgi:hypothetical protein